MGIKLHKIHKIQKIHKNRILFYPKVTSINRINSDKIANKEKFDDCVNRNLLPNQLTAEEQEINVDDSTPQMDFDEADKLI